MLFCIFRHIFPHFVGSRPCTDSFGDDVSTNIVSAGHIHHIPHVNEVPFTRMINFGVIFRKKRWIWVNTRGIWYRLSKQDCIGMFKSPMHVRCFDGWLLPIRSRRVPLLWFVELGRLVGTLMVSIWELMQFSLPKCATWSWYHVSHYLFALFVILTICKFVLLNWFGSITVLYCHSFKLNSVDRASFSGCLLFLLI